MFENEDFNLDESWFAENLPGEIGTLNPQPDTPPKTNTEISSPNNSKKVVNSIARSSSSKKVVLKRKFPGPAGLFPDDFTRLNNNDDSLHSNPFVLSTQFLCSQNINLTFQEPTWEEMCKDFKSESMSSLLNKYNIKWITNNIDLNLVNKRVPIFVGIVKQVKNTTKSPIFVLADPTGELEALISPELYEELSEFLNVNAVLILKKFSILSINKHKHYLNIANENLVRIYTCKDVSEDVKIVHIQRISNKELEEEVKHFISRYEQEKDGDSFKCDFNKTCNSNFKRHGNNSVFNSLTNINNFKSNCPDDRSANIIFKNNSFSKIVNYDLPQVKQNYIVPDKNPKSSLNKVHQESKNLSARPSTSSNIFDQSNNSLDLDLSIEDFEEELPLSKFSEEGSINHSDLKNIVANHTIIDTKKRKLHSEIQRSKIEVDPNFNKPKNGNASDKLQSNISNDFTKVNSKSGKRAIDYSQISILTQTNENSDIIKEILCDLDVAALFDEDF